MSGGDAREGTTDECRNHEDGEECNCDTAEDMNKYPEKPKTYMTRADVYKLIDGERDYQDKSQAAWDDSRWSISDWVVFIRRYLEKIDACTGHPREQMAEMRKVAALAVACMEFNRTRSRNGSFGK